MSDSQPTGNSATPAQTRTHFLTRARRTATPVRNTFVQTPPPPAGTRKKNSASRAGPMATFVNNGDQRGLVAYLMVLAITSAENSDGWATTLDNRLWARLLGTTETTGSSPEASSAAIAAAYRTFTRLESRKLITRERVGRRQTRVTLLREDGTGKDYTRPDGAGDDRFLKIPHAIWKHINAGTITTPGIAMLLAASKEPSGFDLRAEYSKQWYGWSPESTHAGFSELERLGIITVEKRLVAAPASPTGQTQINTFRLKRPYTHLGRKRPKKKP